MTICHTLTRPRSGLGLNELLDCALAVLAVLYYYVARIWLTPNFALYATVLFAAGLGFFICTIQLMTRHYVEGMIFCLGAIITYNHGVKRQSLLWMLISANFYFFAMLAKEFYAPLPLFLFFMHSQLFGKRILFLFAHAIVALAYILWRFYIFAYE